MRGTQALLTSLLVTLPAIAQAKDDPRPRGSYEWVDPELVDDAEPTSHTSNIIYLNRCEGGCTITRGSESSVNNTSSIVYGSASIAPFAHGDSDWDEVVRCVRGIYEPYDVVITDEDPGLTPHFEAIVAGTPQDIGRTTGIGGVSPFRCSIINNAITFSFANIYRSPRDICETVAQETAHAFGLEHEYLCEDPMTYLDGCGEKWFRDVDAQCGEFEPRSCRCGGATQNSHQRLLGHFGPADPVPPEVDILRPPANSNLQPGFGIQVEAIDDVEVSSVELYIDGELIASTDLAPYAFNAPDDLEGIVTIEARAIDNSETVGTKQIEVNIGSSCAESGSCPGGRVCYAGFCVVDASAAGGFGSSCEVSEDCLVGVCAADGDTNVCTASCTPDGGECPSGFGCVTAGEAQLCWPGASENTGGCSASGGGRGTGGLALIGLALALHLRRRENVSPGLERTERPQ